MPVLFIVRRACGKIVAQHLTREIAEREIEWHRASGDSSLFGIEQIEREPSWGYGIGAPRRAVSKWPSAKIAEFILRYKRGDKMQDIERYFGSSLCSLGRLRRKLGIPHRWLCRDEYHRGFWTDREEALINHMYDEGISIGEISANIPRTCAAIEERLRDTAAERSERSLQKGRYRTLVRSVLEESGGFSVFEPPSCPPSPPESSSLQGRWTVGTRRVPRRAVGVVRIARK